MSLKAVSKRNGCVVMQVPHPGYYESMFSNEFDSVVDDEAESRESSDKETQDPVAQIDAGTYQQLLSDNTDWRAAEHALNMVYVECLDSLISELIGRPAEMTYESMDSPREYNYTTDRVYADIPLSVVKHMLDMCKREGYTYLRETIAERCTSRSGFMSFYTNDLDSWLAKPVEEWDHNELGILLQAIIAMRFTEEDGHDFRWHMYYRITEDSDVHSCWNDSVNWSKFDHDCIKHRDEMIADAKAKTEARGEVFVVPEPRCTDTFDMFKRS